MKQNWYRLDKMAKSILGDVRHLQIPVWMILCRQVQALILRTYEGSLHRDLNPLRGQLR
jgi:hypothetical protein